MKGTVYTPGNERFILQDLLKKRKQSRNEIATGVTEDHNPCSVCTLKASCQDVNQVKQCNVNPIRPRMRLHRQPRVIVHTGERICIDCEVREYCSLKSDNKTRCVLWRRDKKW